MKTNYINQLQRDLIGEIGRDEPQEQSILSIEDKADKWVFEINGHKWSNNDSSAGDNYGSFIAGANEMLPIIKELGEALKEIQEANTGGVMNTHWMQNHIQTTLDKYKQYL